MSAYMHFVATQREHVKQNTKDLTNTQIVSELARLWKSFTEASESSLRRNGQKGLVAFPNRADQATPRAGQETEEAEKDKGPKPTQADDYLLHVPSGEQTRIRESQPQVKPADLAKILGEAYNKLSEEEKVGLKERTNAYNQRNSLGLDMDKMAIVENKEDASQAVTCQ